MTQEGRADGFARVCTVVVILMIPVSFVVFIERGNTLLLETKVPIVDVVIPALFIAWIFRRRKARDLRDILTPAAPMLAFAFVSLLSLSNAVGIVESAKEAVQLVNHFILAAMLFVNSMRERRALDASIRALCAVTFVVIAYGLYQLAVTGWKTHLVSSLFDNRNVLAGYLAITLPLIAGIAAAARPLAARIGLAALVVAGFAINTSPPSFLCAGAAVIVTLCVVKKRPLLPMVSAAALAIVVASPLGLGFSDFSGWRGTFFEPRERDRYHEKIIKSVQMMYRKKALDLSPQPYRITVASSMLTESHVPGAYVGMMVDARKKDAEFGEGGHVDQRFLEWNAALDILRDEPMLGVGIGNYQRFIGHHYGVSPKLNTMEPDSQNGYLVILFTTGLAGFACFAWILIHFFTLAVSSARRVQDAYGAGLTAGLIGSLVAFSTYNVFCPLAHQATAVAFILVLGMIHALSRPPAPVREMPR